MPSKKIEMVRLVDLKSNKFVRVELDPAHVAMLKDLIESKVELPPIVINHLREIIDGRHRKDAYEECGKQIVACEVVDVTDPREMIALAYRANLGGSKPPTRRDTEHTIVSLLNHEVPKKDIAAMLSMPPSLARRFIEMVQNRQEGAKIRQAAEAMLDDNLPLAKAAEEFGVEKEKLKSHLNATRKKKHNIGDTKREMGAAAISYAKIIDSRLKQAVNLWRDGELSEGHVKEILVHAESLNKRQVRNTANLRGRIEAMLSEGVGK